MSLLKKTSLLFGAGLVAAIICFSAASLLGGADVMAKIDSGEIWIDDSHHQEASKVLAFDHKTPLVIGFPTKISYVKQAKSELFISGSQQNLDRLELVNGKLQIAGDDGGDHSRKKHGLEIEIRSPLLPDLTLNGMSKGTFKQVDQANWQLKINGMIKVEASGRVQTLAVEADGMTRFDLSELLANNATLKVDGMGRGDIRASQNLKIDLDGMSKLIIHQKPVNLTINQNGLTRIEKRY